MESTLLLHHGCLNPLPTSKKLLIGFPKPPRDPKPACPYRVCAVLANSDGKIATNRPIKLVENTKTIYNDSWFDRLAINHQIKIVAPPSKFSREFFAVFTTVFFPWLIGKCEVRESEFEGKTEKNVVYIPKCSDVVDIGILSEVTEVLNSIPKVLDLNASRIPDTCIQVCSIVQNLVPKGPDINASRLIPDPCNQESSSKQSELDPRINSKQINTQDLPIVESRKASKIDTDTRELTQNNPSNNLYNCSSLQSHNESSNLNAFAGEDDCAKGMDLEQTDLTCNGCSTSVAFNKNKNPDLSDSEPNRLWRVHETHIQMRSQSIRFQDTDVVDQSSSLQSHNESAKLSNCTGNGDCAKGLDLKHTDLTCNGDSTSMASNKNKNHGLLSNWIIPGAPDVRSTPSKMMVEPVVESRCTSKMDNEARVLRRRKENESKRTDCRKLFDPG